MEGKNISNPRLERLFAETVKELQSLGIPINKHIKGPVINIRAKSRFGCCKAEKKSLGQTVYTIEISDRVLAAGDKQIKEIIAHELLHTCRGCMNHGKKWKMYAEHFNKEGGYNITRVTSPEALGIPLATDRHAKKARPIKYVLICQKCGARIERTRKCKVVDNPGGYRCGKCGGSLKLAQKPLHLVDEK